MNSSLWTYSQDFVAVVDLIVQLGYAATLSYVWWEIIPWLRKGYTVSSNKSEATRGKGERYVDRERERARDVTLLHCV